jgi:dihydrofolate reductase
MRRIIVSEWVSLDGVFDDRSMGEWYLPFHTKERGEYIKEGILACDAILLGRTTYEMLYPYWSSLKNNEMGVADKLNNAPKFVVSASMKNAEWNNSTIIKENLIEEITRLKSQEGQGILIMGSATLIQSLMEADLIDEFRFLIHPVIMGSGKRFFKDGMHTKTLQLINKQTLGQGVELLCYQPAGH